ncbi:hypothetical protein Tco_1153348 [Tanacetum coccineum]
MSSVGLYYTGSAFIIINPSHHPLVRNEREWYLANASVTPTIENFEDRDGGVWLESANISATGGSRAPASGPLLTGSSLFAALFKAREDDERHQEDDERHQESRQDRPVQIMHQQGLAMPFQRSPLTGKVQVLPQTPEPWFRNSKAGPWFRITKLKNDLSELGIDLPLMFKKKLGNGEDTRFWLDIWVGNSTLKDSYPRLFHLESIQDCRVRVRAPTLHVAASRNATVSSIPFGHNHQPDPPTGLPIDIDPILPLGLFFHWQWQRQLRSSAELMKL